MGWLDSDQKTKALIVAGEKKWLTLTRRDSRAMSVTARMTRIRCGRARSEPRSPSNNRDTNRNPTAADGAGLAVPLPLVTELKYEGADSAVKAYAIAPHVAGGDESNVRIRCDAPTDCQVYVACDGEDGTGGRGEGAGVGHYCAQ